MFRGLEFFFSNLSNCHWKLIKIIKLLSQTALFLSSGWQLFINTHTDNLYEATYQRIWPNKMWYWSVKEPSCINSEALCLCASAGPHASTSYWASYWAFLWTDTKWKNDIRNQLQIFYLSNVLLNIEGTNLT